MLRRVVVCTTQIPFVRGGNETLVEGLVQALERRGVQTEVVKLPLSWQPKANLLQSCLAWRMLDLTASNGVPIDAVICTNFPSYQVRHPAKVVWLVHQHRQIYDLYGTPFSDFAPYPEDEEIRQALITADIATLGETPHRFAISGNVAERLRRYNGLDAQVLYPPPRDPDQFRPGPPGTYLLSVGRLDAMKRVNLLLEALARMRHAVPCQIAGTGPDLPALRALAERLGIADRVTFLGWVSQEQLVNLYAGARAVYFAPFDEDYGYITIEAFLSAKPVVTTHDAGGALEFVVHEETGLVTEPTPPALAAALDRLVESPTEAAAFGQAGHEAVRHLTWERTLDQMLEGLA